MFLYKMPSLGHCIIAAQSKVTQGPIITTLQFNTVHLRLIPTARSRRVCWNQAKSVRQTLDVTQSSESMSKKAGAEPLLERLLGTEASISKAEMNREMNRAAFQSPLPELRFVLSASQLHELLQPHFCLSQIKQHFLPKLPN